MISDGIKVFVESKGLEALSELLSVDSASLLLASLKLAYSLSSQSKIFLIDFWLIVFVNRT